MLPIWNGAPTVVNKVCILFIGQLLDLGAESLTAAPHLSLQVANGIKMTVTTANYTEAPMIVLHVYGSDYDMGYAYGQLMAAEMADLIPLALAYMAESSNLTIPEVQAALNVTYATTKPYTPGWWYDILRGLSDGSGLDYWTVAGMSLIPELIKAQCSILGAWGPATVGGSLLQLRALDWDTDGPFQKYPTLVTWHPTTGANHTTLAFAGLIGAITGISSNGMSISEKVWDAYTGTQNVFGYVWTFLLQDILRFDADTDQALSRMASANRTCAIWIGLGDKSNNQFKLVSYSNQIVNIYNPVNFPSYPNHDLYKDLLFVNKHVQPSSEPCMNDAISWLYGKIDALAVFQQITALEQTGDMHIMVMDRGQEQIYVASASPGDGHGNGVIPAYNRPFLQFSTAALWGTTPDNVLW